MLETDINTLRESIMTVLNGFLAKTGWIAVLILAIEYGKNAILIKRGALTPIGIRKWMWESLLLTRKGVTYVVGGLLLVYLAYAVINFLATWLGSFCTSSTPFGTQSFLSAQTWAGLSGMIASSGLVFGGISFALSLGKMRWLVGLGKFLVVFSFSVIFLGVVLTCNLPQM